MPYKVKLIKGRSYQGYGIKAEIRHPEMDVDSEEIANNLVATGYFSLVSAPETSGGTGIPNPDENGEGGEGGDQQGAATAVSIDDLTVAQLKEFAGEHNIDISGLTKKPDILARVLAAGEEVETEGASSTDENGEGASSTDENGEGASSTDENGEGGDDSTASGSADGEDDGVIGSFIG